MLEKWLMEEGGAGEEESHQASKEKPAGADVSAQVFLQSQAGVACIGLDESGRIFRWDGSAESLFGYSAGQVEGRDLSFLVTSPDKGETLRDFFNACLRNRAASDLSISCVNRRGDILFCRWYATAARQESGERGVAVLVKDVTEQVLAVNDVNRVRQQARSVFNSAPVGIFQVDSRQRVIVANPELSWMLGYESSLVLTSAVENVTSLFAEPEQAETFLFQLYEGEQLSRFRCRLRRRDGGTIWALCYGQVTRNASDRMNGFFGFCIDISRTVRVEKELKRVNEELRLASILDGLTRIPNRRHFDDCMTAEWKRHARESSTLSVILCDIDHFKLYNDTYGHQAGDDCLVQVAKSLESCVHRSGDIVARYGGEEFVVILPSTDLAGARHLAEKMRRRVEELAIAHKSSHTAPHVTLSLGVATLLPHRERTSDELIRMADRALYAAKEMGRNRWVAREESPDVACLESQGTTDPS